MDNDVVIKTNNIAERALLLIGLADKLKTNITCKEIEDIFDESDFMEYPYICIDDDSIRLMSGTCGYDELTVVEVCEKYNINLPNTHMIKHSFI